jgi:hypothetical protein
VSPSIPARLHVLLARDASTAVVFRRGPTRHTAVVGWDRKTDQFAVGQWLYGRIYERRCDLSPDGKHLIYFAMNGRWQSEVGGSWTAISRAPYLRALTLHAKGDGWHGGGLFQSNRDYWLNGSAHHRQHVDQSQLVMHAAHPWHAAYGGECPGVYYIRLQRDGWTMKHLEPDHDDGRVTIFDKRVNDHWTLRKHAHATTDHPVGRGCYFDTHALHHLRTGEVVDCGDWEWADVDGARVVWAAAGRLHAARVGAGGLSAAKLLHDFNPMRFERLDAPYASPHPSRSRHTGARRESGTD